MKGLPAILALSALLLSPSCARVHKPDFSGVWVLDGSRSDFGSAAVPTAGMLTIFHQGPVVRISSLQQNGSRSTTRYLELRTDGVPVPNQVANSEGLKVQTTFASRWKRGELITTYRMAHLGHFDDYQDVWIMGSDNKALTLLRNATLPDGASRKHAYTLRMVYMRQSS